MRLIDADAIYKWYTDAFDFSPNEIRFSMNDIRDNLWNIPTVDVVQGRGNKGGRLMTNFLIGFVIGANIALIIYALMVANR